MYYDNKKFKNIVDIAVNGSTNFYGKNQSTITNPYFIGFGNPNSKIIIFGQEKAIDSNELETIKLESKDNPIQWGYLIKNKIDNLNYKFPKNHHFQNPLNPYAGKVSNGTWVNYQKLIKLIYPNLTSTINNSFLTKSFISEINSEVSKNSLGNQKNPLRTAFLNHSFFIDSQIIILAVGEYLKDSEVEKKFNVKKVKDLSEKYKKLIVYQNSDKNRIVVRTRQLSNLYFSPDEYLNKIANEVKDYI